MLANLFCLNFQQKKTQIVFLQNIFVELLIKRKAEGRGQKAEGRKRYKPCPQVAQKIKNILCESVAARSAMRSTRTYSSASYLFPL
jgi:hypothetical protein